LFCICSILIPVLLLYLQVEQLQYEYITHAYSNNRMNANIRFKEKMREGVYKTINAKRPAKRRERGGGGENNENLEVSGFERTEIRKFV